MNTLKLLPLLLIGTFLITASCVSCDKENDRPNNAETPGLTTPTNPTDPANPTPTGNKMKIIIGNQTFTATLYDNATAVAFKALLPLTTEMVELNGNEKYFDLPQNIPSDPSNPGTIKSGDLMLYGSNTLVLFYEDFNTSYRYTRLGRVDDLTGFKAALGRGNVKVTYRLQ